MNISRDGVLDPALMGACNRIVGQVPREVDGLRSRSQLVYGWGIESDEHLYSDIKYR